MHDKSACKWPDPELKRFKTALDNLYGGQVDRFVPAVVAAEDRGWRWNALMAVDRVRFPRRVFRLGFFWKGPKTQSVSGEINSVRPFET